MTRLIPTPLLTGVGPSPEPLSTHESKKQQLVPNLIKTRNIRDSGIPVIVSEIDHRERQDPSREVNSGYRRGHLKLIACGVIEAIDIENGGDKRDGKCFPYANKE